MSVEIFLSATDVPIGFTSIMATALQCDLHSQRIVNIFQAIQNFYKYNSQTTDGELISVDFDGVLVNKDLLTFEFTNDYYILHIEFIDGINYSQYLANPDKTYEEQIA
jgi:hypothetical protein